jgi:hypothetical protein
MTYIFSAEMIIKIYGLTPKVYINNFLNFFDCMITIIGIIDLSKKNHYYKLYFINFIINK